MSELLQVLLYSCGVVLCLFLLGVLAYYPRARKWKRKAQSEGDAVCRDCGHTGQLSYGFLSGVRVSSANIRLVCAKCEGENWYVPGGRRDKKGRGTGLRHAS